MAKGSNKAGKFRRDGDGVPITEDYTILLANGTRGEIRKKHGRWHILLPSGNRIVPAVARIKRRRKG